MAMRREKQRRETCYRVKTGQRYAERGGGEQKQRPQRMRELYKAFSFAFLFVHGELNRQPQLKEVSHGGGAEQIAQ